MGIKAGTETGQRPLHGIGEQQLLVSPQVSLHPHPDRLGLHQVESSPGVTEAAQPTPEPTDSL